MAVLNSVGYGPSKATRGWEDIYLLRAKAAMNVTDDEFGHWTDTCARSPGSGPWTGNSSNGTVTFTTVQGPTINYDSSATAPGRGAEMLFATNPGQLISGSAANDRFYYYGYMSLALGTTPNNLVAGAGAFVSNSAAANGTLCVGLVGTAVNAGGDSTNWCGYSIGSGGTTKIASSVAANTTYRHVEFWYDGTNINLRIDGTAVTPVAATNYPSAVGTMQTMAAMVTSGRAILRVKRAVWGWRIVT